MKWPRKEFPRGRTNWQTFVRTNENRLHCSKVEKIAAPVPAQNLAPEKTNAPAPAENLAPEKIDAPAPAQNLAPEKTNARAPAENLAPEKIDAPATAQNLAPVVAVAPEPSRRSDPMSVAPPALMSPGGGRCPPERARAGQPLRPVLEDMGPMDQLALASLDGSLADALADLPIASLEPIKA